MKNDWVKVTTEELATLVGTLDKALALSLINDNKVYIKIEGAEVLYTDMTEEDRRLAPARAAWRELKDILNV